MTLATIYFHQVHWITYTGWLCLIYFIQDSQLLNYDCHILMQLFNDEDCSINDGILQRSFSRCFYFCLNHISLPIYIYIYIIFSLLYTVYTLILSILFYTVFCCKEQGGCCTRYTVWTYRSYLHSIHTSKLLIRAS